MQQMHGQTSRHSGFAVLPCTALVTPPLSSLVCSTEESVCGQGSGRRLLGTSGCRRRRRLNGAGGWVKYLGQDFGDVGGFISMQVGRCAKELSPWAACQHGSEFEKCRQLGLAAGAGSTAHCVDPVGSCRGGCGDAALGYSALGRPKPAPHHLGVQFLRACSTTPARAACTRCRAVPAAHAICRWPLPQCERPASACLQVDAARQPAVAYRDSAGAGIFKVGSRWRWVRCYGPACASRPAARDACPRFQPADGSWPGANRSRNQSGHESGPCAQKLHAGRGRVPGVPFQHGLAPPPRAPGVQRFRLELWVHCRRQGAGIALGWMAMQVAW